MKTIKDRLFKIALLPKRSAFLWGPRKTGKTYWRKESTPRGRGFDLPPKRGPKTSFQIPGVLERWSNGMELKEESLKSGKLLKKFLFWASCVQYSGRSFFQHSTTPPPSLRAKKNTGRAIFSDPAPRTGFLDLNKFWRRIYNDPYTNP